MKQFLTLIFLVILFFSSVVSADAQESKFQLATTLRYQILSSGATKVSQRTTITNKDSNFSPEKLLTTIDLVDLTNVVASDRFGLIPVTIKISTGSSQLSVTPHQPGAGLGKTTTYNLNYQTNSIIQKLGNVYIVTIPKFNIDDSYSTYDVTVDYSNLNSLPFFVSPANNSNIWHLAKGADSGIQLLFWVEKTKVQNYFLSLKYSLTNKKVYSVSIPITLPSDGPGQKVAISKLSPPPVSVSVDPIGNWVATYNLQPNSKQTVDLEGGLQLSQNETSTSPGLISPDLREKLWAGFNTQVQSEENCVQIATRFKTLLEQNHIRSHFVSGNLFPTRDALHCWLEYFDTQTFQWVVSDPYIALKTQRKEYLSFWDPLHLRFGVILNNPEQIIPTISQLVVKPDNISQFPNDTKLDIHGDFGQESLAGFNYSGKLNLQNFGPIALTNLKIFITTKGTKAKQPFLEIPTLPPYGKTSQIIALEKTHWTYSGNDIITLEIDGKFYSYPVNFIPFYQSKPFLIIGGLFAIAIIFIATQITRGVFFQGRGR